MLRFKFTVIIMLTVLTCMHYEQEYKIMKMKQQLNTFLKECVVVTSENKIRINKEKIFSTKWYDYVPLIRNGDIALEDVKKYINTKPFKIE